MCSLDKKPHYLLGIVSTITLVDCAYLGMERIKRNYYTNTRMLKLSTLAMWQISIIISTAR